MLASGYYRRLRGYCFKQRHAAATYGSVRLCVFQNTPIYFIYTRSKCSTPLIVNFWGRLTLLCHALHIFLFCTVKLCGSNVDGKTVVEVLRERFLPHDAMHSANYAVARCLSHTGILSKWLNISSNFFHCRVATQF